MKTSTVWYIAPILALAFVIYNSYKSKEEASLPGIPEEESVPENPLRRATDTPCGFRWTTTEPETIEAMKTQALSAKRNLLGASIDEIQTVETRLGNLHIVVYPSAWTKDLRSRCRLLETIVISARLDSQPAIPVDVSAKGDPYTGREINARSER